MSSLPLSASFFSSLGTLLTPAATLAASLAATLALTGRLSSTQGELGGSQPVGQLHLRANGISKVGYNQDILDVVVAELPVSIRMYVTIKKGSLTSPAQYQPVRPLVPVQEC